MYTLAIDPGVRELGWALFRMDEFVTGGVSSVPGTLPNLGHNVSQHRRNIYNATGHLHVDFVAVEAMEYADRRAKSVPADLLRVQWVGAALGGMFATQITPVTPTTWKRSVPKDIHHKRIRAKLTKREAVALERAETAVAAGLRHNLVDAVGIGLWAVRRAA